MTIPKEIQKRLDDIDKKLVEFTAMKAACRGPHQEADHDIITKNKTLVGVNKEAIEANKKENIKAHDELKAVDTVIIDKLETATGNLNQAMSFIGDMQRYGKLKVGVWTTIISGAFATVLAAFIIWVGTIVYDNIKKGNEKENTEEVLRDISIQLKKNSEYIKKVEEKVNRPAIIIEESVDVKKR